MSEMPDTIAVFKSWTRDPDTRSTAWKLNVSAIGAEERDDTAYIRKDRYDKLIEALTDIADYNQTAKIKGADNMNFAYAYDGLIEIAREALSNQIGGKE